MGSPWPALLIFLVANLVQALATGGKVSIMTITEFSVMIVSLVAYVGLIGSVGSDPADVGAAALAIARTVAITAFVASIVAVILTNYLSYDMPIITFLDIAIGGFAVFGAISAAKPGAT